MLARQYSIPEVKTLLNASEGAGPGVGGHAIGTHGHLRADPTDRGKLSDSAFADEIRIFGKRLVTPGAGGAPARKVAPTVSCEVSKPVRSTSSARAKPALARSSRRSRTGIAPLIH